MGGGGVMLVAAESVLDFVDKVGHAEGLFGNVECSGACLDERGQVLVSLCSRIKMED
jgi:hypothetical protein